MPAWVGDAVKLASTGVMVVGVNVPVTVGMLALASVVVHSRLALMDAGRMLMHTHQPSYRPEQSESMTGFQAML
jgi:hypothetical protein